MQDTETTQVIAVDVSVEVKYSGAFLGDQSVRDRLTQQWTLIGSGETRVVTLGAFTIKQGAEVSVKPRDGGFTVSTGAMELQGAVDVSFDGVRQQGRVTLTTEDASS